MYKAFNGFSCIAVAIGRFRGQGKALLSYLLSPSTKVATSFPLKAKSYHLYALQLKN